MMSFLDTNHTHSSNPLYNVMNADNPFVKNTAVLFISAKQLFLHTKYKYLGIFFMRQYYSFSRTPDGECRKKLFLS